jgi:hypothetical protein
MAIVALYARVSTKNKGQSIKNQLSKLRRLPRYMATAKGAGVVATGGATELPDKLKRPENTTWQRDPSAAYYLHTALVKYRAYIKYISAH